MSWLKFNNRNRRGRRSKHRMDANTRRRRSIRRQQDRRVRRNRSRSSGRRNRSRSFRRNHGNLHTNRGPQSRALRCNSRGRLHIHGCPQIHEHCRRRLVRLRIRGLRTRLPDQRRHRRAVAPTPLRDLGTTTMPLKEQSIQVSVTCFRPLVTWTYCGR